MTLTIDEIIAQVKPPETVDDISLRGDLVAEYEQLQQQLPTASSEPDSLGELSPAAVIEARMAELRTEMAAETVRFHMRAIGSKPWSDLFAVKPDFPKAGDDGVIDPAAAAEFRDSWHLWVCEVLARSCYDPVMTVEQADALSAGLSDAQWQRLTDKAYNVNVRSPAIPFSGAASVPPPVTSGKRRRPTN
jgi:hypothetical protein